MLRRVLPGRSDANIRFADLTGLLHDLGFTERIRGDHHIFTIILRYRLGDEPDAQI
jgi:hypothetical protein